MIVFSGGFITSQLFHNQFSVVSLFTRRRLIM